MRHFIKIFIIFTLISTLFTLFVKSKLETETAVLSLAVEITPTVFEPPSPTNIPTPTTVPTRVPILSEPEASPSRRPTPVPTTISTPTPVPQPVYSQEQIHGFIERFSAQYGVDPNVMRFIAICESGFDASAVNGPYAGLYQFGKTTWINNRTLMGEDTDTALRFNAEEAAQTAAYIVSIGKSWVWPNCTP